MNYVEYCYKKEKSQQNKWGGEERRSLYVLRKAVEPGYRVGSSTYI